jgi:hypothetical protein
MSADRAMTTKQRTVPPRHTRRQTIKLEIELPVLSDEAAAAMADVLVQLYHRFEATYYAQILNHHAHRALARNGNQNDSDTNADPF